ncbi:MAG: fibronectin type III domain-containing protein [Bacteroidales bacterium]|nr:fibronectin type III domain-containing protein [Bacteroidales bacterium]
MKNLYSFTLLLLIACLGTSLTAQQNPPTNVTATALSYDAVQLTWGIPSGTTQPLRLNLWDQSQMVIYPGGGYDGNDVSCSYGGQTILGRNINENSHFKVGDDFTLPVAAHISTIDFFAYQTGSTTTSSITAAFVSIYDTEPVDSTSTPVWTSGTTSCMTSSSWTGIYRTSATALSDTTRPIMRVTTTIDTLLPAGTYWVTVSMTGSISSGPWCPPVCIMGQVSTGNGIQLTSTGWQAWSDDTSLEQLGVPFVVKGYFANENLLGFNVYRDNVQVNTSLIDGFTYTDEGLTMETPYCYSVEAVYSTGGNASSQLVCVTTLPDPCTIFSMPYEENFDTYGTGDDIFPTCWTRFYNGNSTVYPYITNTNYSAPGSLYFYSSTAYYDIASTPKIDSNIAINTLRASMMLRTTNNHYYIVIGTITDPTDGTTFHPYDTLRPFVTSTWVPFHVDFNNYTGNDHYIALRCGDANALSNMNVDNFNLNYIPTCEQPTDITYIPDEEQVTVSWTPGATETLWNVSYMFADETDWTTVYGLTSPSYTISGLTPHTDYQLLIKVQADCGGGDVSYWTTETLNFSTFCVSVNVPYEETFDSYGTGTTTFVPCWNRGGFSNSSTTYPYINTTNYSAPGSLYFYGTSATQTWATTPKINGALNTMEVSFKLRKSSANYKLMVGVMTNPLDNSTFVPIDTLSPSATSTWESFSVPLTSYTGNGQYVAFMTPAGSANYMYLDNLLVDIAQTCLAPATISAANTTPFTAEIVWSAEGNVSSYNLQYMLSGDTAWTTVENISDTTYLLTNLVDGALYQVRLNSNCGDGTQSHWSEPVTIQTQCLPITTLPYFEGFDTYGTGTGTFPTCFTKYYSGTVTTYPYVHSTHASGVGSLYLYSTSTYFDRASLPALDSSFNVQNLQVSFKAYKTSANYKIVVGIMSDLDDPTTFVAIDTVAPTANSTWQSFEVPFNTYAGTGRYITFHTGFSATNAMYIDEVEVDYIPSCQKPYDLVLSNPQPTSLTASWKNYNANSSAMVQYKEFDDGTWSEMIVSDTFAIINNLIPNMTYQIRVSALCADGSQSAWTDIQTANTGCAPISTFPYHNNFDCYGTGSGTFPACWTKSYSGTVSAYPYIYTTYYTAPGALYMYASSTYYVIAALPEIDNSINLNQLQVSFMARKGAAAYQLVVGTMSDPTDYTSFVPLDTVAPNAVNSWESFDVPLSAYTGTNHYIAFRSGSGTALNTIYIDNVVVDYIPTCFRPSDVSVADYAQNEATVFWTPGASETSWNLSYKPADDTVWTTIPSLVDTFYALTGLTSNTIYEVRVQADCGGTEYSDWTNVITFHTMCDPVVTLPYTEDFESYPTGAASYPACWSRITNATSDYPYVTSTAHNSTRSLYFYTTTGTYCYAVLPELDASIDISNLVLSSYIRKSSAAHYLEVGVMTNPFDRSTFQLIERITPDTTTVFEPSEVYFIGYTGPGRFIAIRSEEGVAATMYMDDIVLSVAPDCFAPQHLTASNILATSATVSWDAPASTSSWDMCYGVTGFNVATATPITLGDDHYTLTNLMPNTTYDVYVRSMCPDGPTEWTKTSFTTSCTPVTEFPFTEDFDDYGTGSSAFPSCWTKISNTSTAPYITSTTASTGLTLPGALYFYSASATYYQYAVMPEMDVNMSDMQISLAFKAAMGNVHHIDVGVMTDAHDTATFELIETIEPHTAVWNGFTVPFTSYTGTGRFIAFRTLGLTTCYIDHLVVDYAPGCVMPHNLVVDSLTTTTASVSWTPGHGESEWILSYGPVGYFPNVTGTQVTVTQPNYTLAGLDPATTYDFYVKAVCSPTETSDWSNNCTFQTNCLYIDSLPYTENFDDYGTGTLAFPTCWDRYTSYLSSTRYPYINTTHYSGVGALYFYSTSTTHTIATMPEFDPSIDISTLRVNVKLNKSSAAYNLKVGVIEDPTDISTFVAIDTLSPSTTSVWESFSVDLDSYTGNGRYIAFVSNGAANYMYMDDVMIQFIPTCEQPTNVHLTALDVTTATVAWDVADTLGTSWEVNYGPAGFTPGTGTTVTSTTPSATITGLTANTTYDVYVKQICGPGEESIYAEMFSFSTLCNPIDVLPFTENFDSYTGSTSTTISVNNLPDCWGYFNNGTITSYAGYPALYSNSTYAASGTNSVRFYAYTTTSYGDQMLILPALNTTAYPLNNVQLEFEARGYSTSNNYNGLLYVGVLNNVTDFNSFVPVDTVHVVGTTFETYTVNFDHYTGTGVHIAIWAPKFSNADYNVAYLDNISLDLIPCEMPTNIQVSGITSTSAQVSWTPGGSETSWTVAYRETTGSSWITLPATTPSVTLSNLMPETNYSVRVQADCGNGQSEWTTIDTFATTAAPNCPTPANLQVAVDGTTATFSWTQEPNTANEWEFYYRPVWGTFQSFTVTNNSYTINNLSSDATYEAFVVAHCTNGVISDPSNVVAFTVASEPTCPSPTNLTATLDPSNHTTVILTWQQETGTANEWQVNYRQTTESDWSSVTANATTYTLSALVPNVDYEINVVAHCINGLTSDPSNIVTIHTDNVGIQSYLEKAVNLYPNPATEMVSVEVSDAGIQITGVEVYNVYGQVVETFHGTSLQNRATINVSSLAGGMYYVRVTTDGGVVTKNFVKR